MTIKRGKWFDVDALLLIHHRLIVVSPATMVAAQFILLDSYHHVIGQADMDEGIHTSSILLEHLSLLDDSWEISEDEAISASIGKSEQLKSHSVFDLLVKVLVVDHVLHLQEEGMAELLRLPCELGNILHNLHH